MQHGRQKLFTWPLFWELVAPIFFVRPPKNTNVARIGWKQSAAVVWTVLKVYVTDWLFAATAAHVKRGRQNGLGWGCYCRANTLTLISPLMMMRACFQWPLHCWQVGLRDLQEPVKSIWRPYKARNVVGVNDMIDFFSHIKLCKN